MPERTTVVKPRQFSYSGLFSFSEIHQIIQNHWLKLGYEKMEIRHEVKDFKTKTEYDLWATFEFEYTDQESFHVMQILNVTSFEKVEVSINGEKKVLNKGNFFIQYTGRLKTDIDDIWRSKGIYRILSYFANTYIFNKHLKEIKKKGREDCEALYDKLMRYFNAYRDYEQ
ncbi:MAG: hypothetical protein ACMXYA_01115 [Candidatus Woesearchaeota archaeon]